MSSCPIKSASKQKDDDTQKQDYIDRRTLRLARLGTFLMAVLLIMIIALFSVIQINLKSINNHWQEYHKKFMLEEDNVGQYLSRYGVWWLDPQFQELCFAR